MIVDIFLDYVGLLLLGTTMNFACFQHFILNKSYYNIFSNKQFSVIFFIQLPEFSDFIFLSKYFRGIKFRENGQNSRNSRKLIPIQLYSNFLSLFRFLQFWTESLRSLVTKIIKIKHIGKTELERYNLKCL